MGENYFNIHDTVLLVSSIECFILSFIVKMIPGQLVQVRNLLMLFFIVIGISLGSNMVLWKEELSESLGGGLSFVLMIMVLVSLIKGPLLYVYARSVYKINTAVGDVYAYIIPIFLTSIAIITMLVFGVGVDDWASPRQLNYSSSYVVFVLWWLITIIPVVYAIKIFVLLKNAKGYDIHDDIEGVRELAFSKVVIYCFGAHWIASLMAYISSFFTSPQASITLGLAGNYFMFVLLKVVFVGGVIAVLRPVKVVIKNDKNKVSDHLEKIKKIENAIYEKKLHLDKTINLNRFSQRIDLSAREVSLLIHMHHKCNFVDFINHNRVKEAKINLSDVSCSRESIKSIALRSGFNSISSFNRIFTKYTHMSPSEYRSKSSALGNKYNVQ